MILLNNIWIGIISGIISAVICVALYNLYKKVLIPFFERMVYKDIDISGKWKTKMILNDEKYEETAKIIQKAHRIKGIINFKIVDGKEEIYKFKGEFKNLISTAEYWKPYKSDRDRGTFTLEAKNNGLILEGFGSIYQDSKDKVVKIEYQWEKQSVA